MSSLFGSISIALSSMMAQQSAVSVTANNVSNVNTPGYSRQRAELVESPAVFNGHYMVGTGVQLEQITSLRDRILEIRLQGEQQQQGALKAQVESLQDVETLFSSQTQNISDAIDNFFNSLSALSTNASSVPLRQSVLMNARNLADSFRSASTTLQQRQFSLDLEIRQAVMQVNQITPQIAELNARIASSAKNDEALGSFVDQRNLLLQNLSELIGNQVFTADDGLTVTTNDGSPLVIGNKFVALTTEQQPNGSLRILSDGADITSTISGGRLNGLLQVRQQTIPGLLDKLDTLASGIATSVNALHQNGFDLDGARGADFFITSSAGVTGAASAITLSFTDPRKIAAGLDASAGSNGNLNRIVALRDQPVADGQTPAEFYANLTFDLGSAISNAQSDLEASELVAQELANQRGSVSGVSLDEEAANLIRYQRAYEAAARVLSVLGEMTEISVNLGK